MMNLTPRINRIENNLIIDGGMEFWPEGTSRSVANNTSFYGSVLMKAANTSTGVTLTNDRQASVPSNTNLVYSNRISKTAAGTLAAGTISALQYTIEGYDLSSMISKESSLIFWVKSSVASNRGLSIQNGSASHAFVQQYTINQANTWELKVIKFPALNTCPGTLDRTNGAGATIIFSIVSGSNFQTSTLNSWVAGPKFSGIGEDTTWLTGTNHDFSIAGVMALPGDWTSLTSAGYEFIRAGKNFQDELAMSGRYYEKSYNFNEPVGTSSASENFRWRAITSDIRPVTFKIRKRTTSTVIIYSPFTGASGFVRDVSAGVDRSAIVGSSNEYGFQIDGNATPSGNGFTVHFSSDARF